MRFRNLYILLLFSFTSLQAQKEANNWYFGFNAGITFNTTPPSFLTNGAIFTSEGCASISALNGRLLFYTDGVSVWDSTHTVMPNGSGLKGASSSSQSALIVPKPNTPNIYYVFTVVDFAYPDGLQYSEINMKLNSGKGDIVNGRKNIKLKSQVCEKIVAVKHTNGKGFWILTAKFNSDSFFAYSVTEKGVNNIPIGYKTGFNIFGYIGNVIGYLKVSPNGKKVAFANSRFDTSIVGDFDASTGKISNLWKFYHPLGYGIEFSPNNRFLYTSDWSSGNITSHKIMQYDLTSPTLAQFISSRKTMVGSFNQPGALQLGPDGKIYITEPNSKYLSVIHAPDSLGFNGRLQKDYIYLSNKMCGWGLPPSIKSIFWNSLDLGSDTILCFGDSIKLVCHAAKGSIIKWNTGSENDSILIKKQGTYSVIVKSPDSTVYYDTIIVRVGPKFKVFIGNDTAFCHQFSHIIKASQGFKTYNWNTGSNAMQITVNSKGIYSVKVLDSNTCPSGDTIAIDQIQKPVIKLSYDSINCQFVYLSTDSLKGLTYLWSTGETKKEIKVSKKGWISLTASHNFCSNKDSVYVSQLPTPEIDLGIDTSLCANELVLKTNEQGSYLWSTMETRPSIVINQPGKYWLTVTRNNCSAADTINVKLCEDMLYYIPDVFSPNGDNINEVFRIYGSNIVHIEMEIFNRWGELLLKTSGKDVYWDGSYKNELCMESVYFYKATIKGRKPGSMKNLKGSVTLIR